MGRTREFGALEKTKAAILVVPPGIKDLILLGECYSWLSASFRMKPGDMVKASQAKLRFPGRMLLRARYAENPKITILRDGGEIQVRLAKDGFQSQVSLCMRILEDEWMEWERKSGIRKGKKC